MIRIKNFSLKNYLFILLLLILAVTVLVFTYTSMIHANHKETKLSVNLDKNPHSASALNTTVQEKQTTQHPISKVVQYTNRPINQKAILANAKNLKPTALKLAVDGYHEAKKKGEVENSNVLTIIDFTLPSYKKRMWVIDLNNNDVLMKLYTTQGKNSGVVTATKFSNKVNSEKTSLGVYKTLNTYIGKHGKSLRLQGLEPGVNDNAYKRAVVIHPANYATPDFVDKHHRTGRSWGCFAVNPAISKKLVNTIKNGSILFAYNKSEEHEHSVVG